MPKDLVFDEFRPLFLACTSLKPDRWIGTRSEFAVNVDFIDIGASTRAKEAETGLIDQTQ